MMLFKRFNKGSSIGALEFTTSFKKGDLYKGSWYFLQKNLKILQDTRIKNKDKANIFILMECTIKVS